MNDDELLALAKRKLADEGRVAYSYDKVWADPNLVADWLRETRPYNIIDLIESKKALRAALEEVSHSLIEFCDCHRVIVRGSDGTPNGDSLLECSLHSKIRALLAKEESK